MGDFGAKAILAELAARGRAAEAPVRALTHCNTGSLATAAYGTALGVVRALAQRGMLGHAFCTETRPYNQGAAAPAATRAFWSRIKFELSPLQLQNTGTAEPLSRPILAAKRRSAKYMEKQMPAHCVRPDCLKQSMCSYQSCRWHTALKHARSVALNCHGYPGPGG